MFPWLFQLFIYLFFFTLASVSNKGQNNLIQIVQETCLQLKEVVKSVADFIICISYENLCSSCHILDPEVLIILLEFSLHISYKVSI